MFVCKFHQAMRVISFKKMAEWQWKLDDQNMDFTIFFLLMKE